MKMEPVIKKEKEHKSTSDYIMEYIAPYVKEFYESDYQEVRLVGELKELWCTEYSATRRVNFVIKELGLQDKIRGQYNKKDGMVHLYRPEA